MYRRLVVGLLVLVVAGGVLWWTHDRSDPGANAATAHDPRPATPADALRTKPFRTRWAPLVCQPSGVVRTRDGAPARDAVVTLHAAPLSQRLSFEPVDAPDTRTGSDGHYALPATAAGTWVLVAAAPGMLAAVRQVTIGDAGDCANLDLVLGAAGHAVSGTIRDVSSGGVREVMIVARLASARAAAPVALAMTRDDGHYEMTVGEGDYAIQVRHPEYVGVDDQIAVRGPTTFDAVLTPGAAVRGTVLAAGVDRRTAVPGARVTIRGGRASGAMGGLVREVVSDERGRFSVTGLGSGRIFIAAVGPGHASREPVEIALGIAESRDEIEVLVEPARRIRGIVTSGGAPVDNALVTGGLAGDDAALGADERSALLASAGSGGVLAAETDADGVFELWGLAPAVYEVAAEAPRTLPSKPGRADATKGDVDSLVLDLGKGVVVRGRVVPAQVATVSIGGGMTTLDDTPLWTAGGSVTTGADGKFELGGVAPGETTLSATTYDGSAGERTLTVPDVGANDVVVELAKAGVTVSGNVVDARGAPVAGVTIGGLGAVTGTDGRFRIYNVEPGQLDVAVYDGDDTLAIVSPALHEGTLEVPPSGLADLTITVEARDRTLRGIVIDPDGRPAADAWVVVSRGAEDGGDPAELPSTTPADSSSTAFDWSGRNKVALTDADGRFAIDGLRAGVYDVAAEGARGSARGAVYGAPVDRQVRVALTALGGMTIAVVRDGAPVGQYQLGIVGPEPDQRSVRATDGRIALTSLPPGEYEVRAATPDAFGRATVLLPQGKSVEATITLGAWATVTGHVVDASTGKPLPEIMTFVVDAQPAGGSDDAPSWISDGNGRFRIEHVPPGPGQVVIYTGVGDGIHVSFTVGAGATIDVGVVRTQPPPPSLFTEAPADPDTTEDPR